MTQKGESYDQESNHRSGESEDLDNLHLQIASEAPIKSAIDALDCVSGQADETLKRSTHINSNAGKVDMMDADALMMGEARLREEAALHELRAHEIEDIKEKEKRHHDVAMKKIQDKNEAEVAEMEHKLDLLKEAESSAQRDLEEQRRLLHDAEAYRPGSKGARLQQHNSRNKSRQQLSALMQYPLLGFSMPSPGDAVEYLTKFSSRKLPVKKLNEGASPSLNDNTRKLLFPTSSAQRSKLKDQQEIMGDDVAALRGLGNDPTKAKLKECEEERKEAEQKNTAAADATKEIEEEDDAEGDEDESSSTIGKMAHHMKEAAAAPFGADSDSNLFTKNTSRNKKMMRLLRNPNNNQAAYAIDGNAVLQELLKHKKAKRPNDEIVDEKKMQQQQRAAAHAAEVEEEDDDDEDEQSTVGKVTKHLGEAIKTPFGADEESSRFSTNYSKRRKNSETKKLNASSYQKEDSEQPTFAEREEEEEKDDLKDDDEDGAECEKFECRGNAILSKSKPSRDEKKETEGATATRAEKQPTNQSEGETLSGARPPRSPVEATAAETEQARSLQQHQQLQQQQQQQLALGQQALLQLAQRQAMQRIQQPSGRRSSKDRIRDAIDIGRARFASARQAQHGDTEDGEYEQSALATEEEAAAAAEAAEAEKEAADVEDEHKLLAAEKEAEQAKNGLKSCAESSFLNCRKGIKKTAKRPYTPNAAR